LTTEVLPNKKKKIFIFYSINTVDSSPRSGEAHHEIV